MSDSVGAPASAKRVNAQRLLVQVRPDEVATEMRRLRDLFPTGLVISLSREALLFDIPADSIAAVFAAATVA